MLIKTASTQNESLPQATNSKLTNCSEQANCTGTCTENGVTANEGGSAAFYNSSQGTCANPCASELRLCVKSSAGRFGFRQGALGYTEPRCVPATNCGTTLPTPQPSQLPNITPPPAPSEACTVPAGATVTALDFTTTFGLSWPAYLKEKILVFNPGEIKAIRFTAGSADAKFGTINKGTRTGLYDPNARYFPESVVRYGFSTIPGCLPAPESKCSSGSWAHQGIYAPYSCVLEANKQYYLNIYLGNSASGTSAYCEVFPGAPCESSFANIQQ